MTRKLMLIGMLFGLGATALAQMIMDKDTSDAKFMLEMKTGMERMDHDMAAAPMNGNADHDFAAMMMPHHQGAIDMARSELSYGKDPDMRRLAEKIIVDQQSELELMSHWLQKTPASTRPETK
jgi:uncharacterized protein (DUF305 family)